MYWITVVVVARGAPGVTFFVVQSGFVQKPVKVSVPHFPFFFTTARPSGLAVVLARMVTALKTSNVVYNVVPDPAPIAGVSVFVGAVVVDRIPL
jgi:hypothetical protein